MAMTKEIKKRPNGINKTGNQVAGRVDACLEVWEYLSD